MLAFVNKVLVLFGGVLACLCVSLDADASTAERTLSKRIINGDEIHPPFLVTVDIDGNGTWCSGTVMNEYMVLIPAQMAWKLRKNYKEDVSMMRVHRDGKEWEVERLKYHNKYQHFSNINGNNIALLQLKTLIGGPYYPPCKLPKRGKLFRKGYVAGHGFTPQWNTKPKGTWVKYKKCDDDFVEGKEFCFQKLYGKNKTATCKRDQGGPVFLYPRKTPLCILGITVENSCSGKNDRAVRLDVHWKKLMKWFSFSPPEGKWLKSEPLEVSDAVLGLDRGEKVGTAVNVDDSLNKTLEKTLKENKPEKNENGTIDNLDNSVNTTLENFPQEKKPEKTENGTIASLDNSLITTPENVSEKKKPEKNEKDTAANLDNTVKTTPETILKK